MATGNVQLRIRLRDQTVSERVAVCKASDGLWVVSYRDDHGVQRLVRWASHRSAMSFADAFVRERSAS